MLVGIKCQIDIKCIEVLPYNGKKTANEKEKSYT